MPNVLIIDDEEGIAWALRKACECEGHKAFVAASADYAVSVHRRLAS